MTSDPLEECARLIVQAIRLVVGREGAPTGGAAPTWPEDLGVPPPLVCAYAWASSRLQATERPTRDEVDFLADFSRLSADEMKSLLDAAPIIQRLRGLRATAARATRP